MTTKKHNWTLEEIQEIALKYSSSTEMQRNDPTAWYAARRYGWWKQVSSHMSWHRPKWSFENIKKEALKYDTRRAFQNGSGSAYQAARGLGILNDVCGHMRSGRRGTAWTLGKIHHEALKFSTRSDFYNNSPRAYDAARRHGWFDEVCSHMTILWEQKWDKEKCRVEAKKYLHRKDFHNGTPGAYGAARNNGWLDEVCSHMTNKSIKWTQKKLLEEAKKYRTRTDFNIGSSGAYKTASDQGILDEICDHMEILHNGYNHCVYAIYNVNLNLAYVGITSQKFEDRMSQHRSTAETTRSRKIAHLEDTIFEQQTDYVYLPEEVKSAEATCIEVFRSKGFKILNSNKAIGGIGYSRPKWTFEMVQEEAKNFKTRWEFQQNSRAYAAAKRRGWLDDACSHMKKVTKGKDYWTLENCKQEAEKFSSIQEFRKKYSYGYKVICKNKWNSIVWAYLKNNSTDGKAV